MIKDNSKWITVAEYAKQIGKSRAKVYQDIVYKRIPASNWKNTEVTKKQILILDTVHNS